MLVFSFQETEHRSRLAKLDINREEIDRLNKDVEEVIEDQEDVSAREPTKGKWVELAKLVGEKERGEEIAAALVEHSGSGPDQNQWVLHGGFL